MSDNNKKNDSDAMKALDAKDQINQRTVESPQDTEADAMIEEISSVGLGKVNMDQFGQARPDKSADQMLGWHILNKDTLPSKGKFYPENLVIQIRSAKAKEIRHFSTMDETNYIDMEEKLNVIVESCTQLLSDKQKLSYKDLLEEDRIIILLSIRDLSFPEPENKIILKGKTEKTKRQVDVELSVSNLIPSVVPTEIEDYYSNTERTYVIKTRSAGVIRMKPPTIGVMEEVTSYLKDRQEKGVELDKAFVQILPYIADNWRNLNLPGIFNLEVDYKSWSEKKFMIIYRLAEKMKIGVETTLETEFDGEIAKAPLDFPGGIKSLFIISDLAGELL